MMKEIVLFSAALCAAPIFGQEYKSQVNEDKMPSFIAGSYIPDASTAYMGAPLYYYFNICRSGIDWNERNFIVGDKVIHANVHWLRDYILILKSRRYTDAEIKSFFDLVLDEQTPDGFFYEIITSLSDVHGNDIVPQKFRKILPNTGFGMSRLEIEADIEYLCVEGAYYIWQATGDDNWLKKAMPKLEKGLNYIMTDPTRWDKSHNLAKRVYTIDTWDFINAPYSGLDRSIMPDNPMGAMHGDNTGLCNAMYLMGQMYSHLGDKAAAEKWNKKYAEFKENVNKHLWNGRFYKHYLELDKANLGVDLANQLSLSNSYNLNRNVASPQQCRAILQTYRLMRENYGGLYDDFRTLDPSFPVFNGYKAGRYTNGGVGFYVAGQLAVGAFENGMEDYGVDILMRTGNKVYKTGKISFLYDYAGNDTAGGPRGWVGAELMYAQTRGLAGVVDNGKLFKDITLSPRFVYTKERKSRVFLKYPVSGAFVDYSFEWQKPENKILFTLYSKHDKTKLRMLMPPCAVNPKISVNGKTLKSSIEDVFGSKYLVVENFPSNSRAVIDYQMPVEVVPYANIFRNNFFAYIINNSDKDLECELDVQVSGYKSIVKRKFTLFAHEKRHVEILSLKNVAKDGSAPRIILKCGENTFKVPFTLSNKIDRRTFMLNDEFPY